MIIAFFGNQIKETQVTSNPCHFHYSPYPYFYLSYISVSISFVSLLQGDESNVLLKPFIILYVYQTPRRDCSSIGQSTALSRRKLRVRAPSVPN